MPLRIAIAGVIALAACIVIPVSVSAVSSAATDGAPESADEAEPPEPYSSSVPMAAPITGRQAMGATLNAAGYGSQKSWLVLLVIIAGALIPSMIMIARSAARGRAGPQERLG
jgi:hypothetical protein